MYTQFSQGKIKDVKMSLNNYKTTGWYFFPFNKREIRASVECESIRNCYTLLNEYFTSLDTQRIDKYTHYKNLIFLSEIFWL